MRKILPAKIVVHIVNNLSGKINQKQFFSPFDVILAGKSQSDLEQIICIRHC